MERLIKDIVKAGIPVTINYMLENGLDKFYYEIPGFYKCGTVRLEKISDQSWKDNVWECHARYNEVTIIESLYDLIFINYDWWIRSKRTCDPVWKNPDPLWENLLLETVPGIKKTVKEVVVWDVK